MKQTLDLNKMGLMPMTENEMQEIDGGNIFKAIGNAIESVGNAIADAAEWTADNMQKISQGAAAILSIVTVFEKLLK
jgi:hypothetical protein